MITPRENGREVSTINNMLAMFRPYSTTGGVKPPVDNDNLFA
jgi:hypothetical protein